MEETADQDKPLSPSARLVPVLVGWLLPVAAVETVGITAAIAIPASLLNGLSSSSLELFLIAWRLLVVLGLGLLPLVLISGMVVARYAGARPLRPALICAAIAAAITLSHLLLFSGSSPIYLIEHFGWWVLDYSLMILIFLPLSAVLTARWRSRDSVRHTPPSSDESGADR
jgi:hypothetical protein